MAKKQKCLICGKVKEILARGVCNTCHSNARYKVKNGETTVEQLVELGLWAPKRQTALAKKLAAAKS
jgi:hypothetical protein